MILKPYTLHCKRKRFDEMGQHITGIELTVSLRGLVWNLTFCRVSQLCTNNICITVNPRIITNCSPWVVDTYLNPSFPGFTSAHKPDVTIIAHWTSSIDYTKKKKGWTEWHSTALAGNDPMAYPTGTWLLHPHNGYSRDYQCHYYHTQSEIPPSHCKQQRKQKEKQLHLLKTLSEWGTVQAK